MLHLVVERGLDDRAVVDAHLALLVDPREGVFHPVDIVTVGEVLASVRTAALLALLGGVHGDLRVGHQVVELERLDEVGVPHHALVRHLEVVQSGGDLVNLLHALGQGLLRTEHGGVVLHHPLHRLPDIRGGVLAVAPSNLVQVRHGILTRVGGNLLVGHAGLEGLGDGVRARTAENDDVEKGVGAEAVGAVHGGARALTRGEQARHGRVLAVGAQGQHLTLVVGGDATHVVVHGGDHRDGLLGDVHTGEDRGSLRDTRQTLGEELGGKVVEVEVDVVLFRPDAASLANLEGHRARHDIARGEVLGGGRVTLHEALTLAVPEDTTLAARALGDEAPGAVDAGGVELDKLLILHGETRARRHRVTVSRARVRGRRGEVRASVASRRQHRLVRPEPVEGSVLHAHRDDADALALVHDEINRKILHEELGVVLERLSVEGVKHRVSSPVRGARAPVRLATLAVVQRLAPEGALVDLAVVGATEGQAVVLELDHSLGRLAAHVLDGILVTEPVRTLDGVVRVPPPVVLGHVSESGVDATLRGYRVRTRGEELGDARRLETVLGQADGGAKTRTTRTDDDGIVLVVDDGVSALACR